jgi:NADH-quinone oxidoreductase subunit A
MSDYLPILVMTALVIAFVMLSFIASQLLNRQRGNAAKQAPYECGIVPEGVEKAERFPVKFYLVAMSFIVLDVEIVFLYPFSTVMKGLGPFGLVAMGVFLLVLIVPFGYLLSSGALAWGPVKQVIERTSERFAERVRYASGAPGRDGLDPSGSPDDAGEKAA